ncbi:unnamed protein product [Linum trigynum]|uniref:Reverse transcriptase n=1 Tax=Linum trigynum TaxID=586398 RepID=A0AAV2CM59_9ROSI
MARQKRNAIKKLQDESEQWFIGTEQIFPCLYNYFMELFKVGLRLSETPILNSISHRVSKVDNELLLGTIDGEDIYASLKQMGPRKTPGADGLSAYFSEVLENYGSRSH